MIGSNGMLRAEDNANLRTLGGSYSLGLLTRVPVSSSAGGTELPAGVNALGSVVGAAINDTGFALTVNNLGSFGVRHVANIAPLVSVTSHCNDDAIWHSWVVSYDLPTTTLVVRKDGSEVARATDVAGAIAAGAGAAQLVIAGAGAAFTQGRFTGDIGAVFNVAALGIHTAPQNLTALETYLAGLKAATV
jgi:hypothetical protein